MSAAASGVYLSSKEGFGGASSVEGGEGEGCFRPLVILQKHLLS